MNHLMLPRQQGICPNAICDLAKTTKSRFALMCTSSVFFGCRYHVFIGCPFTRAAQGLTVLPGSTELLDNSDTIETSRRWPHARIQQHVPKYLTCSRL